MLDRLGFGLFGIGGGEFILILLFVFLIVGPDKLPGIMRTIGKAIAKFRSAQTEMNEVIQNDVIDKNNPDQPFKDPTNAIDKLSGVAEKHLKSAASEASSAIKSRTHDGVAETATAAAGTAAAVASAPDPHQETFTERKARYERERAARREAEEKRKAEEAAKQEEEEKAASEAEAASKAESEPATEAAPAQEGATEVESEPAAGESATEAAPATSEPEPQADSAADLFEGGDE